jgi:hypothetical protein
MLNRLLFPLALVFLLPSHGAWAQSSKAAAEALFADGREAMGAKDFDLACSKFAESRRLDPAIGTELNLANCEEQRGRLATAWLLYRTLLPRMALDDPRRAVTEERARTLESHVPRLRIKAAPGAPSGVRVRVGEMELTEASFGSAIPLDPGSHVVTVRAPGQGDHQRTVTLSEGTVTELIVPFDEAGGIPDEEGPRDAAPGAQAPNLASPRPSREPREPDDEVLGMNRDTATFVTFGVGAAGLVLGTLTGLIGLSQESTADDNCDDATKTCNRTGYDANSSARTMATLSTIGFAVGLAGVGVGTYVVLTSSEDASTRSSTTSINLGGAW